MPRILSRDKLNDQVSKITIDAPLIARAAKPGQFVVIVPTERAERIPLTIADFDPREGIISIIFQIVGATTKVLASLNEGDKVAHLLGPLGIASEIENFGSVVVIGGGVGIAEIYPVVKALKAAGNQVITIIGARNQDLLLFEKELSAVSSQLLITTDDGSSGRKGFVSDELKNLITSGEKIDRVLAVGPVAMMRACCELTRPPAIKTMVSLNPLMLDATGMCGICRVTVGGKVKFGCVDGPEFDGHEVDFNELAVRLNIYRQEEKQALDHVCRLLAR
jgi:ferredoxin--NADP+ reductase